MGVKTDLRELLKKHTNLKIQSIYTELSKGKVTPNKRFTKYTIEIFVLNK